MCATRKPFGAVMSAAILPAILWIISMAALIAAAIVDFRHRIVPNRIVLVVALCGVGLRLWSEPGAIWLALLTAAIIVVALGLVARLGWIGGGDVKLIGAVSLLFPSSDIGALLLNIAVAGGLMALAYLAVRPAIVRKPRLHLATTPDPATDVTKNSARQHVIRWRGHLFDRERLRIAARGPMPYTVAVLGGVVIRLVSEAIQCLSATSCSL